MSVARAVGALAVVGLLVTSAASSVLLVSAAGSAFPAAASADDSAVDQMLVTVERGDTAELGFTVPDGANGSISVGVGSDDVNFLARATLVDADGDGSVVLRLDTATAGDGDPDSYLEASGSDRIRNATQVTAARGSDEPLDAGTYDLAVGPADASTDAGRLVVTEPSDAESETDESTESATTVGETETEFATGPDGLVVGTGSGRTVRGETELEAGMSLTVRLEGTDSDLRFLKSSVATVTEDGTFAATFDLYDVPPGTEIEATVHHDGRTLAETAGQVVECSDDCETADGSDTETEMTTLPADELAVASVVEVSRARTARIPVTFGDADALTVSIGGPEVNYVVNGTVTDRDGDGRAVVLFHTDRAGLDAPTLSVVDDGGPRVVESSAETSLKASLAAGDYDLNVYRGTDAAGEPAAIGSVVVYESAPAQPSETSNPPSNDDSTIAGSDAADASDGDASNGQLFAGVGTIALGGVLAVAGIGVLLGLFRS